MLNMQKKTLITHYKKHLIMSKDYYTKDEVNLLLAELKKEIIETISTKKSNKKKEVIELKNKDQFFNIKHR